MIGSAEIVLHVVEVTRSGYENECYLTRNHLT